MTEITIQGEAFYIDGQPTYKGREYNGHRIEGLLLNSRMVQATFDDANPNTRDNWAYPDTGQWDPERNVQELLEALPIYRDHGLLAITVNMQGGNPKGYNMTQPWLNSAFHSDGSLKPAYLDRMKRVLDRTDELGMAVILGVFYFGQANAFDDEQAIVNALTNTVNWVLENGYQHVLLEVNNECDYPFYDPPVLRPPRVAELITRAAAIEHEGRRLLVATSFRGGCVPHNEIVSVSDFVLIHGNGIDYPHRIAAMVDYTRQLPRYRPMPIVYNEDDHFNFDQEDNNFLAALSRYASWGYYDPGENDYWDGYQSPPVNWELSTPRKKAFFEFVKTITGS